jgi:folate-binding protein YgfZ
MISETLRRQYDSLKGGTALVELPARTLIRFTGADNRRFLHSFCTADVKASGEGSVKEAFILDTRGKTLAFGHLILVEETILLSVAAAGIAASLIEHLDRYVIRDDVQIEDLSDSCRSLLITAPGSKPLDIPGLPVSGAAGCEINSVSLTAVYGDFAGPACLLLVPVKEFATVRNQLVGQAGLSAASMEALDMVRLEDGTPWYGIEIDESNLPQEVQRDEQAISFTKGCYLGQETVARIDAIGHVNKLLSGLQISSAARPEIGQEVYANTTAVGRIRSCAYSPALENWLAMAYVKREFVEGQQPLTVQQQPASLVHLPLSSTEP